MMAEEIRDTGSATRPDNKLTLNLQTISPLLLFGADQKTPELRAASIRGELRFWFRALQGARNNSIPELASAETKLFGSTQLGSPLTVRVSATATIKNTSDPVRLVPHNPAKANITSPAIDINQKFKVTLLTRPGVKIVEDVRHAVRLWLLLGGLGKRSRRMFGALDVLDWDAGFWFDSAKPRTAHEYANLVKVCLDKAIPNMATYDALPKFPILHTQFSQIFISDVSWNQNDSKGAMRYLFEDHLRNSERPFVQNYDVFGYAGKDAEQKTNRRASPAIIQLRTLQHDTGISLHPVVTAMSSEFAIPSGRKLDWTLFQEFLSQYKASLNGVHAWGNYG